MKNWSRKNKFLSSKDATNLWQQRSDQIFTGYNISSRQRKKYKGPLQILSMFEKTHLQNFSCKLLYQTASWRLLYLDKIWQQFSHSQCSNMGSIWKWSCDGQTKGIALIQVWQNTPGPDITRVEIYCIQYDSLTEYKDIGLISLKSQCYILFTSSCVFRNDFWALLE